MKQKRAPCVLRSGSNMSTSKVNTARQHLKFISALVTEAGVFPRLMKAEVVLIFNGVRQDNEALGVTFPKINRPGRVSLGPSCCSRMMSDDACSCKRHRLWGDAADLY